MANNNLYIAAQLRALANSIADKDDDELLPEILDVCSGLMGEVGKRRPAAAQMAPLDLSEYNSLYTAISSHVGNFAEDVRALFPAAPAQQPADLMATLNTLRQKAEQDAHEIVRLQHDISLEEPVVKARDAELQNLRAFYQSLQTMSKECTPEIIAGQKAINQTFFSDVSARQNELNQLKLNKYAEEQRLLKIEAQIKAVPREIHLLVEDYDRKAAELRRLQNAAEECSPEKQQELESRINDLQRTNGVCEDNMAALRAHHQALSVIKTELDRQSQLLSTDLLETLNRSMSELGLLLKEHYDELLSIKQQADVYENSLAECSRIRSGYAQWIGASRTQLMAILATIDQEEYTNLQQTLNVQDQDRIRELLQQAENALQETDRFLRRCADAAKRDLRKLEQSAGGR